MALAVCCLTLVTLEELHLPYPETLLLFIFFGTVIAYNFVKYAGVAKLHHGDLRVSLKLIRIFTVLSLIPWLYFALQMSLFFWLACIPLGLLTLLYALPVFPGKHSLRSIPTLKIFIIAVVCAGTTVLLPVVYFGASWDMNMSVLFLQRVVLVLPFLIPFEIRDLQYDKTQLGTFPQLFGVTKTKILGIILILLYAILEFLKTSYITEDVQFATAIILIITIVAVLFSRKRQNRYYASFWVESIPIVWWLLIWII